MSYYKVVVEKIMFLEAENEEVARDVAENEDYIFCDEVIKSVTKSSRKEIRQFLTKCL